MLLPLGATSWRATAPELLEAVVDSMRDGLAVHDAEGRLVAWNPSAAAITGWDEATAAASFPPDLPVGLVDLDGGRWIDVRRGAEVGGLRPTIFSDARQQVALRDAFGRLNDAATVDSLTGLPNRVLAEDRLRLSVALAETDDRAIGVLHVDLDRFKLINETLGTASGDRLLQQVAQRIRAAIADTDTVARIGDDDFLVVIHDLAGRGSAEAIAAGVVRAVGERFRLGDQDVFVGCSIGVAVRPDHGTDVRSLLSHADLAMHDAKRLGGNGARLYAPRLSEASRQRLSIAGDLHDALAKDQLVLHYQPQVDANSACVVGVEALIRWKHPTRGLVPPDAFLDVAEEDGSILEIDRWVLETAWAQAERWDAAGLIIPTVAVNLSARTMTRGDVVGLVADVLGASSLPPDRLELEVSEHLVAGDSTDVEKSLSKLKDLGVQLAIDDFGTGYSSLAHLKRFPLDAIKLDRSFVIDVTGQPDPADIAVLRAVVTMAGDLNLRCIAEGVETVAQRKVLRFLHCHILQGFLYSRAIGGALFPERMAALGLTIPRVAEAARG